MTPNRSGLGLDPWDVLHQGIAAHTGLAIGTVSIIVGAVVLLGWIPLRQRPGLGTATPARPGRPAAEGAEDRPRQVI